MAFTQITERLIVSAAVTPALRWPDMQYTITINQFKSLEWGLNSQQAMLFAFVYECPSWANPVKTDDGVFFALSKAKIVCELPLLSGKPDTAYRMLKALEDAGLVQMSSTSKITLIRLTDKGKEWNRKHDGSEKNPSLPRINLRQIKVPIIKVPIRKPIIRICRWSRLRRSAPANWFWLLIALTLRALKYLLICQALKTLTAKPSRPGRTTPCPTAAATRRGRCGMRRLPDRLVC